MKPEMRANPLAGDRRKQFLAQTTPHPVLGHARIFAHVRSLAPHEQQDKLEETEYGLPVLAQLAHNPRVTSKDVIKAVADAAGAQKITAAHAIELISMMPQEPEKLKPWLRDLYAANLTALVHLKAQARPDIPAFMPPAPTPAASAMPPGAMPPPPAPPQPPMMMRGGNPLAARNPLLTISRGKR